MSESWLVLDSASVGGIETHVFHLAAGLKKAGIDVSVVFFKQYPQHALYRRLRDCGIRLHFCPNGFLDMQRKIKMHKPEIIHTHGYKAGILGRILARQQGIPVISTFHAGETPGGKVRIYDFVDRLTAFLAHRCLAVSRAVEAKVLCRAELFNNFVDEEKLTLSQGKDLAFVGRLSHEKGADFYIDLAASLPHKTFHIYGGGPLMSELKKDSPTNVIYHGEKKCMDKYWGKIGMLLVTSRYEGLPMTVLECMGRGIPVIGFDVGALSSVISNDKNGWLTAPGDIDAMRERLIEWCEMNESQKNCVGGAARKTIIERFSSEKLIPKYLDLYEECKNSFRTAERGGEYNVEK